MAIVTLTVLTPDADGTLLTWTPGDGTLDVQFTNTGHEILLVRNEDADTARTVTIVTGGTVGGLAVADVTQSVAKAYVTYAFGPFPKYLFDAAGTDIVSITAPNSALKFALLRV